MPDCCSTSHSGGNPWPVVEKAVANNCPNCGQKGQPVQIKTLKQIVQPSKLEVVNKSGFQFCRSKLCEVVYFHPDGDRLGKSDARVRVGLKETQDPISLCYCFGFTEAMVREELFKTGRCTIPERIKAEVKAENCACEFRNPKGSCCLGDVTASVKRLSAAMESHISD